MSRFTLDFSNPPVPRWPLRHDRPRSRWLKRRWLPWTVLGLALLGWWASLLGFFWYSSENRQLRQLYNTQLLRHDSLLGAHLDMQRQLLLLQQELDRNPGRVRPGEAHSDARSNQLSVWQ
ncbi:hypothetical protein GCM10023189_13130 [Nibrella saemangeumensis]|uniref:Cell division protein FtsB n=1 Tax=Nibrella saemangeumensis TaxID=1084526 RepID=A0ABP8MM48_9BACT